MRVSKEHWPIAPICNYAQINNVNLAKAVNVERCSKITMLVYARVTLRACM